MRLWSSTVADIEVEFESSLSCDSGSGDEFSSTGGENFTSSATCTDGDDDGCLPSPSWSAQDSSWCWAVEGGIGAAAFSRMGMIQGLSSEVALSGYDCSGFTVFVCWDTEIALAQDTRLESSTHR